MVPFSAKSLVYIGAKYPIYTVDQITSVLNGSYTDPTFMVVVEEEELEKLINVKYPYFRKPKYVYFDPEFDEESPETGD